MRQALKYAFELNSSPRLNFLIERPMKETQNEFKRSQYVSFNSKDFKIRAAGMVVVMVVLMVSKQHLDILLQLRLEWQVILGAL